MKKRWWFFIGAVAILIIISIILLFHNPITAEKLIQNPENYLNKTLKITNVRISEEPTSHEYEIPKKVILASKKNGTLLKMEITYPEEIACSKADIWGVLEHGVITTVYRVNSASEDTSNLNFMIPEPYYYFNASKIKCKD
jgi:hypothetical protein